MNNVIQTKSYAFAIRIVNAYKFLTNDQKEYVLSKQMLRSGIDHIDAVLLTHEHYDHTSGLDELRNFSRNNPIPIYAEPNVLDIIHQRLFYCFSKQPNPGVAHLELKAIENLSPFKLLGFEIVPDCVWQYRIPIIG